MRKFFKSKMIVFILTGWILFSGVGYLGKDSIYRDYAIDAAKTPYFVLVLQGVREHIYPWDMAWDGLLKSETGTGVAYVQAQELENSRERADGNGLPETVSMPVTEETEPEERETAIKGTEETAAKGAEAGAAEGAEEKTAKGTKETAAKGAEEKTAKGTEEEAAEGTEEEAAKGAEEETAKGNTEEAEKRKFTVVGKEYFEDAVFIGDSRTVGLHDYGGLENTDFFATVGMNVYDLWTERFCRLNGRKVTLEEALSAKQYGKVYFQIGVNEMGRGTLEGFMEKYTCAVEKIRELQPDAYIYLQGIIKVTTKKSNADPVFNNEGIQERNEQIAKLADGITIFYIDVNEVVCDETGGLREDLTFDNLHLYASKYDIWIEFLKSRGIEET